MQPNPFQMYDPKIIDASSEDMHILMDNSIDLIITSPPYGQIKDYDVPNQIGFGEDFNDYFKRLKKVWMECYRVLKPQCRLVINIGDQYLRTKNYGRYRILPIGANFINQCTDIGYDFLGDIIWRKISTTNTTGGCSFMGSLFYPRHGLATYDYEHILIFKKINGEEQSISRQRKEFSKIAMDEWKRWYTGHWTIPGVQQKGHIAMFPEELPYRLIRMFSFIGDTILDPFAGSGTTLKLARLLGRQGIGFEVNPHYLELCQVKVQESLPLRDFHAVIQKCSKISAPEIEFDYEFATQKSIICLINRKSNSRVVIDLLTWPKNLQIQDIKDFVRQKLTENNFQHLFAGEKGWDNIQRYFLITIYQQVDPSVSIEFENQIWEQSQGKVRVINSILFFRSTFLTQTILEPNFDPRLLLKLKEISTEPKNTITYYLNRKNK